MGRIGCFALLIGKRRKSKGDDDEFIDSFQSKNDKGTLRVKLEHPIKAYVSVTQEKNSTCKVKVVSDVKENENENENPPLDAEAVEEAYEGSDEYDENSPSIHREFSDFDLQAQGESEGIDLSLSRKTGVDDFIETETNDPSESRSEKETEVGVDLMPSGHVSDPGIEKVGFWASPMLKRSCSNVETRLRPNKMLIPKNSSSYVDMQNMKDGLTDEGIHGSPASVMTRCSADKVMLKKHSSSQVLPSRSRRLWWKLFLWSHRNMHKPQVVQRVSAIRRNSDQTGGYCSDTLEPSRAKDLSKSAASKGKIQMSEKQNWNDFQGSTAGLWPQNQWVAFSPGSSSLNRVNEWVNSLGDQTPPMPEDEDTRDEGIVFHASPENRESQLRAANQAARYVSDETSHANHVIQTLNSSSTVAHIAGMNLKVIPTMLHFTSLRTVNLSGNFIVRITPGSLPKGLHTLNLSRNKIATIEGLRELTRLRVLDLSYNKIARIGHGLSNCTLIKELYLAGNKISDVEGLHRLLKLTVLDISFNKISTAKALGQLVANYNSLLAINLLGNPIQNNIGDDHLRKVVSGLLPQLSYLNKQAIKPQRAREAATDSVAKAALGNNGWTSRRKVQKRIGSRGSSGSSSYNKSNLGGARRNKQRSNSGSRLHSPEKRKHTVASSSRQ